MNAARASLEAEWARLITTTRRRGDKCLRVSGWIWRAPDEAPRCKTKCGSVVTAFRGGAVERAELATCPRCRAKMLGEAIFRDPWGQAK